MNDKVRELLATQSYNGIPVITVAQLTEILSAGSSTVRSTLCVHKDKFKEGIHYYKLNGQELLLVIREGVIPVNSAATKLTLLTEEGVKLYFYVKATSHQGKALPGKQQKVPQVPPQVIEKPVQQSLVTISGTRCYVDENQIAWLNAEDVARGLGFTQVKNGVEYVMWWRVEGYLKEFGFSANVRNGFIPENMFYRLAMKANNETAQVFQAKVADEILPTLRRTGYYGKQPTMNREEFKQTIAKINQAEEQRVTAIQKVATLRKQLTIAENDLSSLETTIETLYKTVNVSNTPSDINKVIEAAQTVQPLLQDGSYTIGDLHKLVENKMSVKELHDYAKTKGELSDTFNRNRAKLSEEDAAVIMATLGVKLENVSQALLQQTMSFHDVTEKLAALGYTQLQGQNLSASNLLSLLKEQNLPLEEQPHKKGFLIKNNAITKQTFLDLLSFLGKPS